MSSEASRADHVRWCKKRALALLDAGDAVQAVTSMMSDLGKHPETKTLVDSMGMFALFALQNPAEARGFITGFTE